MSVIGTFKAVEHGYAGRIQTLMLNKAVRFVANGTKSTGASPDFHILAGSVEIGAAWRHTSAENETSYLRVRLDDPAWPKPIHAALMEHTDDGTLRLLWRRKFRSGS